MIESDNEFCDECTIMDAVTEVDGRPMCYRCAKKIRKQARVRERYEEFEEEVDNEFRN